MELNTVWQYGRFAVPVQPGVSYHEDNGQVFLADDKERYTISLEEIIKRNCKGRIIRSSYPKSRIILSLFQTESDEKSFAFFKIEAAMADIGIDPIYGQIVFSGMTAKDGIHLEELQKMFSEIYIMPK